MYVVLFIYISICKNALLYIYIYEKKNVISRKMLIGVKKPQELTRKLRMNSILMLRFYNVNKQYVRYVKSKARFHNTLFSQDACQGLK